MGNRYTFRDRASVFLRFFFFIFLVYLGYGGFWHILLANLLVFLLLFLPHFIKKDRGLKISLELECLFLFFLIFASLLGQFFPLAAQFLFGMTMGFLGFMIMFLFVFNRGPTTPYLLIIFSSLSVSITFAALVEMLKFYVKFFLGYYQGVGDYSFAMNNLGFVLLGSALSSFAGYFYLRNLRGKLFRGVVKRFKSENPNLFIRRDQRLEEAKKMILSGEGEKVEFKSTLRVNLETGQPDSRVENSVLKALVSFLNTLGGYVFIGVSDSSKIVGLEEDKFESLDFFNRHLTNLIKEKIGPEYLPYLGFDFFKIESKIFLRISCMKSDGPVFLRTEGKEEFFIRVGASSIPLIGNRLIDYVRNKFGNR